MRLNFANSNFLRVSFGNIIEWYDFALYGILALSLSKNFFPLENSNLALSLTLLTFSASFLARPLGAAIFGILGDKFGHYFSVNLSVWCMAFATFLVGLLPTYQQVGNLAPILLLLLRSIQGAAVGGQFSGLIVIASESATNKSYLTSIAMSISVIGNLLAGLVGLIAAGSFGLISETLAWRVPFLFSGILFWIYFRRQPELEKVSQPQEIHISQIFKQQPYEMFYMTLLAAVRGSIHYILFSYMLIFMQVHLKIHSQYALFSMNIFLILTLICYPIFGRLADRSHDRIKAAKIYTLFFILCIFSLSFSLKLAWIIPCFLSIIILYSAISSHITSLFAEVFAAQYRMTACSLCYNLGAIASGFSPYFSEMLAQDMAAGFYMFLLTLGFALYLIQDKVKDTQGYKNCCS